MIKPSHALTVTEERGYAVYDTRNGHIRHVHRVTFFEGAVAIPQKEQEERAIALAERHGHPREHLQVLAVANLHDLTREIRVDLHTRQLTHGR